MPVGKTLQHVAVAPLVVTAEKGQARLREADKEKVYVYAFVYQVWYVLVRRTAFRLAAAVGRLVRVAEAERLAALIVAGVASALVVGSAFRLLREDL